MEISTLKTSLIQLINQIDDQEFLSAIHKLVEVRHQASLATQDSSTPTQPMEGVAFFEETEEEQTEREITNWLKDV